MMSLRISMVSFCRQLEVCLFFIDLVLNIKNCVILGEEILMSLPTVKCFYSSIDLNGNSKFEEYGIKGKLILTTFKLRFIPHKYEMKNYLKCFSCKKQYFKYWNENEIPMTFIYGVYTCNDKMKRLSSNDIPLLNDQRPKDIIIKCKVSLQTFF